MGALRKYLGLELGYKIKYNYCPYKKYWGAPTHSLPVGAQGRGPAKGWEDGGNLQARIRGCRMKATLAAPWTWTFQLSDLWGIHFHHLKHPLPASTLLGQPVLANVFQLYLVTFVHFCNTVIDKKDAISWRKDYCYKSFSIHGYRNHWVCHTLLSVTVGQISSIISLGKNQKLNKNKTLKGKAYSSEFLALSPCS